MNRRGFLRRTAGAAAGVAFAPIATLLPSDVAPTSAVAAKFAAPRLATPFGELSLAQRRIRTVATWAAVTAPSLEQQLLNLRCSRAVALVQRSGSQDEVTGK